MRLYRIGNSAYIRDISGFGASLHNNRWNSKGISVIYTSAYRSLALLEVLVHLTSDIIRNVDLSILTIDVIDSFIAQNEYPVTSIAQSQKIGDSWVMSNFSVGLVVSSVIIPQEHNVLLNPKHPDFTNSVKIVDVEPLNADKRLFKF